VIVGDIDRNRAARSLALVLTKFRPAAIHFISPHDFAPGDELTDYLRRHEIEVEVTNNLEAWLRQHGREADAIYMTRLQKEWDAGSGGQPKQGDYGADEGYVLRSDYRLLVRPDCVIMHPLPRINELPEDWEQHPGFLAAGPKRDVDPCGLVRGHQRGRRGDHRPREAVRTDLISRCRKSRGSRQILEGGAKGWA
jgi:aspartate carbamoyltransferase catalytic subunit